MELTDEELRCILDWYASVDNGHKMDTVEVELHAKIVSELQRRNL